MPQVSGTTQKLIPAAFSDGVPRAIRQDPYGAPHTRSELLAWAEEGSYFRVTNATPSTGIAQAITTAFAATAAALAMRNSSATKVVIPHYIRLTNTVAPASATSCRAVLVLDNTTRFSSGGTNLVTQIANANTNVAISGSVVDQLQFGAVVAAAASAPRQISNLLLKTQAAPAITVGDEIVFNFLAGGSSGMGALAGAAPVAIVKDIGPVILGGANHSLLLHLFNPANAATPPSWEIEMAWWER